MHHQIKTIRVDGSTLETPSMWPEITLSTCALYPVPVISYRIVASGAPVDPQQDGNESQLQNYRVTYAHHLVK